jgi:FkbM family methyltransferase
MGLKKIARAFLESRGYYLQHREVLPYGVDVMQDIKRLARDSPIRTFFDVGANTGQTATRALKFFPGVRVFAFEPNPVTFSRLPPLPSLTPYNLAIGDQDATATLFCNGGTRDSLIYADSGANGIDVECRTIDTICRQEGINEIDVLKTDTEGNDLAVLRGAREMLKRTRFVYSEFFHFHKSDRGTSLVETADFLRDFGFEFSATYIGDVGTKFYADALFVR